MKFIGKTKTDRKKMFGRKSFEFLFITFDFEI